MHDSLALDVVMVTRLDRLAQDDEYPRRKPKIGGADDRPSDDNTENKRIQLESTQIDLELKRRELGEKSNRWREITRNRSVICVLAAVVEKNSTPPS